MFVRCKIMSSPKPPSLLHDAPPLSLKDSNVSLKVKTTKEKGIKVWSLTCNTLGVEGCAGVPKWGLGRMIRGSIIHKDLHKQKTNMLMHSWSTFGAWTNHGHTQTHKTHHGPNLKEATNLPLIIFFVINHGGYILLTLWRAITSYINLWLKWGVKQNCSSRRELSNNMWHTTYTCVFQGNFWLLMVESQIYTLIPDLSFDIICVLST